MNDRQRIEELLHHFRIKQKDFAQKCGFESEAISNIKREKYKISLKIATKILKAFPEVNKGWLATGEGEMLNYDLSITKLDSESQTRHLIPFYDDVCSIGGRQDRVANMASSQPVEYINTGDWFREATIAIRHYCDSMIEYPSGCILALKEIHDFRLIIPGKDYVIETDEYRVTKKIRLEKDGIRAYSSNEEKYDDGELIHQPFYVPFELLRKIFEVLGCVSKKGSGTMVYVDSNKK
jgi:DNA-binding XRE family transcriptional regulator